MFRPAFLMFALACILVCAAQPSFAARHDAGEFSAELPDGWYMTQDEEVTNFSTPDASTELVVIVKKYEKPAVNEIIAEWAGQTPIKMLTDNSYIYEDAAGARSWGMVAADGAFAEICATEAYDGLGAFLGSLKAADAEKGLGEIFRAAVSSGEVAEWLTFATPPFAEREDAGSDGEDQESTPYEHKTFTANIPAGWTVEEKDESVVFASEAKDGFVIVRVTALASDDGKAFAAFAKEQAQGLGAKNVTVGEGVVEFTTEKGANGMFTQFGAKSLFLLFGGDSPRIDDLIRSIGIED